MNLFLVFIVMLLTSVVSQVSDKDVVNQLAERDVRSETTERGVIIFLRYSGFGLNDESPDKRAKEEIIDIVEVLNSFGVKHRLVYFEGHTDASGGKVYNKRLGMKRAEAIREIFVGNGLLYERTLIASFGSDYPLSDVDAGNRRVEVVLVR